MQSPHFPIQAVAPAWVLVSDQLCCVSDFAHLAPSQRPSAQCPLCLQPVVLKLGEIKIHHYAHQHESDCVASHPESALHLNTKFHFFHQLQAAIGHPLSIKQRCQHCSSHYRRPVWLKDWDEVRIEYQLQAARPDIALLKDGRVVAALEIRATHAVDEQKAAYFQEQSIDWLEIDASPDLYTEPTSWTVDTALPISPWKVPYPAWTCPPCIERIEHEKQKRECAEANRVEDQIDEAMMVDLYYPSGKKYRQIYYLKTRWRGDVWLKAWVEDSIRQVAKSIEASPQQPLDENTLPCLKRHVEGQLDTDRARGNVVDVVVSWRRWLPGHRFVAKDTGRYPFNYLWDEQTRQWLTREAYTDTQYERERARLHATLCDTPQWQELEQVVQQALTHPEDRQRLAAVRSLVDFPAIPAAQALRRILRDQSQSPAVREAAMQLYRTLPPS